MKKVLAVVAVLVILIAIGCGIFYIKTINSPEYAIKEMLSDFKADGYEGLKKHLTADITEKMDEIVSLSKNDIIGSIFKAVAGSDYAKQLLDESSKIKWELGDVLRNDKKARITLLFSYEDYFSGSLDINMVIENGEWKICGIDMPEFD